MSATVSYINQPSSAYDGPLAEISKYYSCTCEVPCALLPRTHHTTRASQVVDPESQAEYALRQLPRAVCMDACQHKAPLAASCRYALRGSHPRSVREFGSCRAPFVWPLRGLGPVSPPLNGLPCNLLSVQSVCSQTMSFWYVWLHLVEANQADMCSCYSLASNLGLGIPVNLHTHTHTHAHTHARMFTLAPQ